MGCKVKAHKPDEGWSMTRVAIMRTRDDAGTFTLNLLAPQADIALHVSNSMRSYIKPMPESIPSHSLAGQTTSLSLRPKGVTVAVSPLAA
eukprot:1159911-Pelagomonas_calceolata.AAC.11